MKSWLKFFQTVKIISSLNLLPTSLTSKTVNSTTRSAMHRLYNPPTLFHRLSWTQTPNTKNTVLSHLQFLQNSTSQKCASQCNKQLKTESHHTLYNINFCHPLWGILKIKTMKFKKFKNNSRRSWKMKELMLTHSALTVWPISEGMTLKATWSILTQLILKRAVKSTLKSSLCWKEPLTQ